MIKKIWNTLRYGDKKTKKYLYKILGLLLVIISCTVLAIWLKSMALAGISIIALILLIGSVQSVSFREITDENKHNAKIEEKKSELSRTTKKQDNEKAEIEEVAKEEKQEPEEIYDEETLKQVMIAYKVKKQHYPVMVDKCESERIYQCPAYGWVNKNQFYLLLLEKEPRCLSRPVNQLSHFSVKRGVVARPLTDYDFLQGKSLIANVFAPYQPSYYRKDVGGKVESRKNLYVLDKDICFTASSVRNLQKLLNAKFIIEDRRLESDQYSEYYKEIYKTHILWRDGVYSAEEYKEQIDEVLRLLGEADISEETFQTYIMQIIFDGLISNEYAGNIFANRKKKDGTKKKRR